ncbi:AAA family ATPase (plasmid) [Paenibacillus thiaminolyticus]|uniref:ATP-dependent metallopeptidase FtsH/Yme1/Tma family protein n=1 Tax=Paenibacillus thiaminolyticus TaxID=49283 RepID=UPI00232BAD9B|nr:FtsH/Yme1/Tma family ATP-dependent metallopeptidase [Paenibacillus thiaminolyticus]WCF11615.1 AAA family ATPase [Paenibacillus thiaminolyticus]
MRDKWNKFKKWVKKRKKLIYIAIAINLVITPVHFLEDKPEMNKIEYTKFLKMVEEKQVKEINIALSAPTFTFTDTSDLEYSTDNPKVQTFKDDLLKKGIDVNEIDPNSENILKESLARLLTFVLYIVILIASLTYFQKQMGRNKKKIELTAEEKPNIKFSQIAGNNEAKKEMIELVDFLKNPNRYALMGAKLPKGVIFYGPPGTGKTLTAKAIAGEAGVPFFSMNGSDFVEMYVGLGASRVRDLFEKARKKAPCIIFIDEIDQLGGSRDKSSHDEQRQTLNAFLSEMDGFNSKEGVIVIGATNRLEDMDPAFIRPGRFDRHIAIGLPDLKGRLEILKVHAKNKPLSQEVKLESLAKMTIGLSGASLEAILNEAAILATVRNHHAIMNKDIDDAYFKMIMKGHKKQSGDNRGYEELHLVAWHEAGHALTAKLLNNQEVPKVTIVPSTSGAGGVAFIIPKNTGLRSKEELINDIKISYAGRAAEFILLGDEMKVTTGAASDIKKATSTIQQMITQFGMSETYGMLNLDMFKGPHLGSDNHDILTEASVIAKRLYQETVNLLIENKSLLEEIAFELIEKETLNEDELDAIIASYTQ